MGIIIILNIYVEMNVGIFLVIVSYGKGRWTKVARFDVVSRNITLHIVTV